MRLKNRRNLWIGLALIIAALLFYLSGPVPPEPAYDPVIQLACDMETLEDALSVIERSVNTKPGNEARILWADTPGVQTPWSIVYLHGFGASSQEGHLVHRRIARLMGANLYLPRLIGHGLKTDAPLSEMTAAGLIESAKQAVEIGACLGDRVLVMGTSTGGTCALFLAANNRALIDALMLYSPNVRVFDKRAGILTKPWGKAIGKLIAGGDFRYWDEMPEAASPYWYRKQAVESVVQLQLLLETTMTSETFGRIDQPLMLAYYYKDKNHQDNIVSVPAMRQMYDEVSTDRRLKRMHALPNAGHHIFTSSIFARDTTVAFDISKSFIQDVLNIQLVNE